ncbi:hypothetical protein SDC9_147622 [bioreactor metagenome]|uniref:Uncharacterized protein n=1 Tax=bioreactor metagenome TaxID=1076179 RepID=A0A645EF73_9ZZZZ
MLLFLRDALKFSANIDQLAERYEHLGDMADDRHGVSRNIGFIGLHLYARRAGQARKIHLRALERRDVLGLSHKRHMRAL